MPSDPRPPRVIPGLFYRDPAAALEWLEKAFGFELRMCLTDPSGAVGFAEMAIGENPIAVRPPQGHSPGDQSPATLGGANTVCIAVDVEDVDAHCARARAAGATVLESPQDRFYGDRTYLAEDCEGHRWHFVQHLRDVSQEDMEQHLRDLAQNDREVP